MPKTSNPEEQITMPRSELASILKRLEAVENPGFIDMDEPKQHFVNVRLYEGKPIFRLYNAVVTGIDRLTGDQTMECQIEVVDGDKLTTHTADYLGILRDAEIVKAELIKTFEIDISPKPIGSVAVKTVDGYNTVATGIMVPLRIKIFKTEYLVKMPDGKEIRLAIVNI